MSASIKNKIKKLEFQIKVMAIFCCFNILACFILFYFAYGKEAFKSIEVDQLSAQSLVIKDKGKIVIEMGATESGGYLETVSHDGQPLASLGKTALGGTLILYHANGRSLIELGNTKNGGYIGTFNPLGDKIIEITRTGYGGDISVYDNAENISAHLTTVANGGVLKAYQKGDVQYITPGSNTEINK
jgi:hypothetical protein